MENKLEIAYRLINTHLYIFRIGKGDILNRPADDVYADYVEWYKDLTYEATEPLQLKTFNKLVRHTFNELVLVRKAKYINKEKIQYRIWGEK